MSNTLLANMQNILKENPPEEAIQELVIFMVFVLVSVLQGKLKSAPNLFQRGSHFGCAHQTLRMGT